MKTILGSFFTGSRASCIFLLVLTLGIFNNMFAETPADENDLPGLAEKEILDSKKVQFENRSNRVASKEFHIQQIELGKSIARKILKENFVEEKDLTVKRIYEDQSGKFSADVLILGENFSFGHINGLVRLLTGYLMEAFEYSYEDARMLSNIIIFYNAIIRKNVEHVERRYNQEVVASLTPEHIGIDRNFANWAGQTEILIPLRNNLVRPGGQDMNTGELQQQTAQSLDDDTMAHLDKSQEARQQEDESRLTKKDEETQKRLQLQEQENADTEKRLQEEKAKAEQDLEKIKKLEEQKKANEQRITEEKKRQAAIRKQLAENIPKVIPKIIPPALPKDSSADSQKTSSVASSSFEFCNNNALATVASSGFYQSGRKIYINSDTKFSLKASDDVSEIDYSEYKIDDGKFKRYVAPFSLLQEGVSEEGDHSIVYHSIDNAGNTEEEKSYFVIIDDSVPKIFMNNKKQKNIYLKNEKIFLRKLDELVLSAQDKFSGVKKIRYKIDDSNFHSYTSPIKIEQANSFTIEYNAEDQVGNKISSVCKINVDEQAPEIKIFLGSKEILKPTTEEGEEKTSESQKEQTVFYNKHVFIFEIAVADDQSGVKQILYRVDKQDDFLPFVKAISFAANSKHVIEIKAIDHVGNIAVRQLNFARQ